MDKNIVLDILQLEKMSHAEQMAILDSIQQKIKETKTEQKERVSGNVNAVIAALKKMQQDLESKLVEFNIELDEKARQMIRGMDGAAGRDGKDGATGAAGRDGRDGRNGVDGVDGKDGISVSDAYVDFDGSLVIKLSDGREINAGEVIAPGLAEKIKLVTSGGAGTVLPNQTGNSGKVLGTDGTTLSWVTGGGGGSGTVTSVAVSGGTTGLTVTGSPITTAGTITLGGTLAVSNGGTGAATLTGYVKGSGTTALTAASTIPAADITGLAASATTDTTNASNISSGTLAAARVATLNQNTTGSAGSVANALTIGTGLSGTSYNGSAAVTVAIDSTVTTLSGTQTLTNKRITARVSTPSVAGTYAINTDSFDMVVITGQNVNITDITTTGTPTNGQKLWISITGTAARTISFNATNFESSTVTLPTTTVTTNRLDVGFVWNVASSKWRCVASA